MRDDLVRRLRDLDFGDVKMDVRTTGWTGELIASFEDRPYLVSLPSRPQIFDLTGI